MNEVLNELFDSLHSGLQGNLETPMTGSDFIFDSVQMMYYSCHKVKFKLSGWLIIQIGSKRKKATINSKSKDDKCFQYAVTVFI